MLKLHKGMFLTLHSDPFLRPVFHLPGEDNSGPHANHVVGHVELQGVKTKHFHPEEANFHRRTRAVEGQRHLQGTIGQDKRPVYRARRGSVWSILQ